MEYVLSCWDDEAGQWSLECLDAESALNLVLGTLTLQGTFGAHPGHDGHILGTLSAIQILVIQDAVHLIQVDRVVACKSASHAAQAKSDLERSPPIACVRGWTGLG